MKTLSRLAIATSCCLVIGVCSPDTAQSQIVPDTTLSNPSLVTNTSNTQEITGGTIVDNHLFHSFEQFSVPTNTEAYFNNSLNIINIFSRITGNSISIIDGLIKANGTANLFLLNPNGILFGPNASLNIGGAFVASTANSIQWANNQEFSAVNPQDVSPLLTMNVPMGLQYGANPGKIVVQGTGNNLGLSENFEIIRDFRPSGLEVQPGQSLILAGGDIELEGGNITASGGRIELWSINNGSVEISNINGQIQLTSSAQTVESGNIQLLGAASVDVSGSRGGDIQIQAENLSLREGSVILADTLGNQTGGNVIIKANKSLQLAGTSPFSPIFSGIFTDAASTATGKGGNLTLETGYLQLANGAQISTNTFGVSEGGTLTLKANQIDLIGGSSFGPSGLFAVVAPEATGQGGNLSLITDGLSLVGGAQVSVGTFGSGNAGTLTLNASRISITGTSPGGNASSIVGNVIPTATGNGGNIFIQTNSLNLIDGGQIGSATFGVGSAGRLTINAQEIQIIGGTPSAPSGVYTTVEPNATGNGGSLTLETESLRIVDGGQIAVSTAGTGTAGNLVIQADTIQLIGSSEFGASGLFANAIADTGQGGNISLTTDQLILQDGATINLSNFSSRNPTIPAGQGSPGNLNIRAGSILLDNQSTLTAATLVGSQGNITLLSGDLQLRQGSLITTNASGQGSGGNIIINSDRLTMTGNSEISASATGIGAGGNVEIITLSPLLLNQSTISATGGQGNIFLQSPGVELRNGSNLSTNGIGDAPGGNIIINTAYLFAVPQENSDITANAQNSFGGRVIIFTDGIFGLEVRENLTPLSDITVSSQLGLEFGGLVEINNQGFDPRSALVQLSTEVVDASDQIAQGCDAQQGNVFVVTGRGGLPENPNQTLQSQSLWQDLRTVSENPPQSSSSSSAQTPDHRMITEAQGWIINPDGQVDLIAQAPTQTSWHQPSQCHLKGGKK
ncbi:filamentous hemagglutinin family outer membrane protein [Gloeothece citriformis PCC 7424]|uniref:Filamentous hemagglutinin family outer membrane protein n=1 Tax=Gloeothece citriformis (strain PCC 7424) TaxID=65393 RepID=B7KC85_GLOC7|nr:S-layer family protein [Gloeothece citriformis]ACK70190.1 filamentous hemagglutinin family outer membrane protein [Gloeothece citriformis PCC 7424]